MNTKRFIIAIFILISVQLACSLMTGEESTPVPLEPTVTLNLDDIPPTNAPGTGLQITPEATQQLRQPETEPADISPQIVGNDAVGIACLGTSSGITCLDETGWQTYTRDDSPLGSNLVYDIRPCDDTHLIIAHSMGLSLFDGKNWSQIEQGWGNSSPETAVCDRQGGVWVAHFKGVSYFDGTAWTTYPSTNLATGEAANDLVRDVSVSPDGKVWVVTANSVAVFDGSGWTVFQEGNGFSKEYFFYKITLDSEGNPWVVHSAGLLHYDGNGWTHDDNLNLSSPETVMIHPDGQIWVGTLTKGISIFATGNWTVEDQSGNLNSNTVHAITADSRGRVWIATEWGLSVLDGSEWITYRMENANLIDNEIDTIGVLNAGPTVPQPIEKAPGSMNGQIVDENGTPISNATIEICVERLGNMYFGDTPCEGQPFVRSTITNEAGRFEFQEIPMGYYVLTINSGEGWSQLTTDLGYVSEKILVEAGENTYLGEVIIQESED